MRPLVTLAVLIVGFAGAILAGTHWSDASLTPHLALDLEGGTEIILNPVNTTGAEVTPESITQAINIIRQRVDASGVAEAEITSQGGSNIVVALPGKPSEETLNLVTQSAQMVFRPVLLVVAPGLPTATPTPSTDPSATTSPDASATQTPAPDATTSVTSSPTATPTPSGGGTAASARDSATTPTPTPSVETAATPTPEPTTTATTAPTDGTLTAPADPSDLAWVTEALYAQLEALDCTDPANLSGGAAMVGKPDEAVVTCNEDGTEKYALGPVEVKGEWISGASSGLNVTRTGAVTNEWITTVKFTGEGKDAFRTATTRLVGLDSPRDQFAIVLDGLVVSAPKVNEAITTGEAIISGSFTRESAGTLARQLNFGALPLTFEVQSKDQISATLGSEQLQKGLLAGLIGLVLVGVYSIAQYRVLGLVTIFSLIVAGILTYLMITTLSWVQGYRLSLPGVTGLIVAIGITADSFIVYFERIRDELRDGRTLGAAIEQGWKRARRTVLASDAVSFLAACVLYFLAVGGVRGFAFTLGMTTVMDVAVVFMFTHPVMAIIGRHRFFAEGHPWSGLDPGMLGARSRYVGRGRVTGVMGPQDESGPQDTEEELPSASAGLTASGARMTIAERKAAVRRAAQADQVTSEGEDA